MQCYGKDNECINSSNKHYLLKGLLLDISILVISFFKVAHDTTT